MTASCPTCGLDDLGFKSRSARACRDPWHGDDHLRKPPVLGTAENDGLREQMRRLVDWVYLYALEGHGGWPDRSTITDPLIQLAAKRPPTQEDADRFKAGAALKSFT